MTKVKKLNLILIAIFVFLSLLSLTSAKKQVRNEHVKKAYNSYKYQQRSAYCLQINPGRGVDDTAMLRFHRETERCYRVGERGPCGEMMVFTIEDANFGVCDCDQSLRCGRPLVFWPAKNRCYYVYDQGPCREGKWLVFGFDLHPVCRRNPCHAKEIAQPSYENKYWFTYKGECYRTYSKGYCHKDDEILFNARTHYRPTCMQNPECASIPHSGAVQSLTCLPGQRLDFYGKCEREFKPLKPLKNSTELGIPVTQRPTNLHCLFCKV